MRKVKASYGMMLVTLLASVTLLLTPCLTMSSLPTESPVRVRVAAVTMGSVEQVLAAEGRVRYEAEWAAISPVAGIVRQVYVAPGDSVTAGQALFRLDSRREEAAMAAALQTASQGASMSELIPVSAMPEGMKPDELDAWIDTGETAQQTAASQLALCTVRADADGTVHTVEVQEHGAVMAGTPAVTLTGKQQELRCALVARDAEKVQVGQQARVLRSGVIACMAVVKHVGALRTDTATGQTVADVTLTPQNQLSLPLGAAVEVEILLCSREQVPIVPLTAVTEQSTVWWVSNGRCYEAPVTVSARDETVCQVNLPVGVKVVEQGKDLLEGQRIKEMKP